MGCVRRLVFSVKRAWPGGRSILLLMALDVPASADARKTRGCLDSDAAAALSFHRFAEEFVDPCLVASAFAL